MIPPTLSAPLPGCVSIDATSPDGYLDNARRGTPTALAHTDILTATTNLMECALGGEPTRAALIGHGNMGVIGVGSGNGFGTPQQRIDLTNESVWVPLLQRLKGRVSDLYLYASQVGGGLTGAQLLYDLARVIDANVYGPTGLLYCDAVGDFSLQMGSQWQVATPSARPNPIQPPPFQPSSPPIDAVRPGPPVTAWAAFDAQSRPLPSRTAQAMARQVLWNQPFQPPGEIGGLPTGRLRVGFGRGALGSFTVYGNAVVRDDANPTRFYPVGPAFRALALGR